MFDNIFIAIRGSVKQHWRYNSLEIMECFDTNSTEDFFVYIILIPIKSEATRDFTEITLFEFCFRQAITAPFYSCKRWSSFRWYCTSSEVFQQTIFKGLNIFSIRKVISTPRPSLSCFRTPAVSDFFAVEYNVLIAIKLNIFKILKEIK